MNLNLKSVPKAYKPKNAALYLIAHPKYFELPLGELIECINSGMHSIYVGVTSMKVGKRFTDHTATRNGKPRHLTGPFIKAHDYTFETCFRVFAEGPKQEMLMLENAFRPEPNMGLNGLVGG